MMTVVCLSVSLSGGHTLNYSDVAVKFSLEGQRPKVKIKGYGHGWASSCPVLQRLRHSRR